MSLQEIKVSREEVLKIVQENKQKHDKILEGAIEGYWIDAESYLKKNEKDQLERINKTHRDQLKKLRKARKDAIRELKSRTKDDVERVKDKTREKGFWYWTGKYPEDHGDDYSGTIRRLELCVDNEVKLDSNEFDSYIRNKWTWRTSFLTSNTGYITSFSNAVWGTGSCFSPSYCGTGSWASNAMSSSYASF